MAPMESGRGTLRLTPRPSPGGTPMPAPTDGTACTTAGTTGLTPTDCGRGTLRLTPRPSPGGTPMPAPTDGTACTTAGTAGTQGLPPMDCGRGTLMLRPSPGGTPMAGTATATDGPCTITKHFCSVLSSLTMGISYLA